MQSSLSVSLIFTTAHMTLASQPRIYCVVVLILAVQQFKTCGRWRRLLEFEAVQLSWTNDIIIIITNVA